MKTNIKLHAIIANVILLNPKMMRKKGEGGVCTVHADRNHEVNQLLVVNRNRQFPHRKIREKSVGSGVSNFTNTFSRCGTQKFELISNDT